MPRFQLQRPLQVLVRALEQPEFHARARSVHEHVRDRVRVVNCPRKLYIRAFVVLLVKASYSECIVS